MRLFIWYSLIRPIKCNGLQPCGGGLLARLRSIRKGFLKRVRAITCIEVGDAHIPYTESKIHFVMSYNASIYQKLVAYHVRGPDPGTWNSESSNKFIPLILIF